MNSGLDDCKSYGDSRMAAMIPVIGDNTVSEKFEYVNSEICFRKTIDDIVSLPRYAVKVTGVQLETDQHL